MNKIIATLLIHTVVFLSTMFSQDEVRFLYNSGLEAGNRGNFESARGAFKKALQLDSLYVPAKFNLQVAEDALANRLPEAAARCYFRAIQLGQADSLDKKIGQLNNAIELSPTFGLAFNERGISYANKAEYDLAIADYHKAIQLLPHWSEIYINLALSCDKSERWDEARSAYRKFLELAPPGYEWYIFHARRRLSELQSSRPSQLE